MNLLLLDSKVKTVSLAKDDPRAVHLRTVLRVQTGDQIDLAVKMLKLTLKKNQILILLNDF